MTTTDDADVAIVGGGPAGAVLGIHLASRGIDVALFERLPAPRWRACGVFSSPLTRRRLADTGLTNDQLRALIRPIAAMEVRSTRGADCRLDYDPSEPACGLDRVRLERALLDRAIEAGVRVHEGATVIGVDERGFDVSIDGDRRHIRARLVVGADGPNSIVARTNGVARPAPRLRHAGLTTHRRDPIAPEAPETPMIGRMIVGDGWYLGIAPVPGGRVNLGLVLGERALRERITAGATTAAVVDEAIAQLPGPPAPWSIEPDLDPIGAALPLAHRVRRRSGPGWLLVGDACGFVDPLSGDGIHRALLSAELAADAIAAHRLGQSGALERYDQRMRGRFAPKDAISWILQVFLSRPAAMDYALRRLASRDALRRTFSDVLADLQPPRAALSTRFIAGLLRP